MESRRAVVIKSLEGERLDVACCALFPELSRKRIKSIIDQGGAYRNKKRVSRAGDQVRSGEAIELHWQEGARGARPGLDHKGLIYVDEDFLVLNKPAGLPTQATLESTAGTVLEALELDLKGGPSEVKGPFFLVHRLDKETSGLLIVARTVAARQAFEEQFKKQMIKKSYLALVAGKPRPEKGRLEQGIAKDPLGKNRYRLVNTASRSAPRRGSPKAPAHAGGVRRALTDYECLETNRSADTSLVLFRPGTGRTHQIRVHSAQGLGCPLLGDKTYGRQLIGHPFHLQALRHMLHALALKFPHPKTGVWMDVKAPLPDDFKQCLRQCGLSAEAFSGPEGP